MKPVPTYVKLNAETCVCVCESFVHYVVFCVSCKYVKRLEKKDSMDLLCNNRRFNIKDIYIKIMFVNVKYVVNVSVLQAYMYCMNVHVGPCIIASIDFDIHGPWFGKKGEKVDIYLYDIHGP